MSGRRHLWAVVLLMALPCSDASRAQAGCASITGEYVKPPGGGDPGYRVVIKQTGCRATVTATYLSGGAPTWSPAEGVVSDQTVAMNFGGNHLVGTISGHPLQIAFGAVVWIVDQCAAPPVATSSCSLAGTWWFGSRTANMTISASEPPRGSPPGDLFYSVAPDPGLSPGWSTASMQLTPLPSSSRLAGAGWKWSFTATFHPGSVYTGIVDVRCSVIEFDHGASPPWCNSKCVTCKGPPVPAPIPPPNVSAFWGGPNAEVHLIEISHSDIYWLGQADDMRIDSAEIAQALDLMATHPRFKWNHECILFVRAFIEFFPEREAEMVQRLQEKRLDFGATFSQPFEAPLYNEVLIRQLYEGRKWFVERYPEVDSARVAFQQDSPAKSLQSFQILNKSGIPFLKASRIGEEIYNWASPDGSTTLTFEQVDYAEIPTATSATLLGIAEQYLAQFLDSGAPPLLPVATGTDYFQPSIRSELEEDWMNLTGPAVWPNRSNGPPPLRYSTVHEYLEKLQKSPGFSPRTMRGERPSLWFAESSWSHHRMFTAQRHAGKALPAAEMFGTFRAMIEGHWGSYPDAELAEAWLNVTLADHGIGEESTPYSMPCRGVQEANKSRPYTPFLCNLVRPQSPGKSDAVYTLKYEHAASAADRLLNVAQQWIAEAVHSGSNSSDNASNLIVVFNQLSWVRDDPVTILLPPSLAQSERGLVVKDSAGADVPSQRINRTALNFVARAVPSLGYASFTVVEALSPVQELPPSMPRVGTPWSTPFENQYYIISPGKGGLSQIVDKATGAEIFDTSKLLAGEWMSLAYTATGSSETRTYRHAGTKAGGPDSGIPTFDQATMGMQRLGNLSGWQRWTCVESGDVRVVFRSSPVPTRCSTVTYDLTVYMDLKRIDYTVHLADWQDCFGVTNRLVFPIRTAERNVSYATNFAAASVGVDEVEDESRWVTPGQFDTWLVDPAPNTPAFERGWRMGPRECLDWFQAEATGAVSVMIGSSVGLFDWTDRAELYGPNEVVLAPELLMHSNGNAGPFQNETGNHSFGFSIFVTAAGWRNGWKEAVGSQTPLTAVWKSPTDPQYSTTATSIAPKTRAESTVLPLRASFLELDGRNMWVSAVKREQPQQRRWQDCPPEESFTCAPKANGVVVRLFDQSGISNSTTVRLHLMFGVNQTQQVNLLELEPGPTVNANSTDNHTVLVTVGHHAIETLRLDMGIGLGGRY